MLNLRKVLALGVLGLGLSLATGASAVSVVVSGPPSGSYAPGTNLTFIVGLDQLVDPFNGYDIFYEWTESAFDIVSVTNLFPFESPFFPLVVDDRGLGDSTTGLGRASALNPAGGPGLEFLRLVFQATGAPGGTIKLAFEVPGRAPGGLSPITATNADPRNLFTFVPEPSTLALMGLGCLGLVAAGRRRV